MAPFPTYDGMAPRGAPDFYAVIESININPSDSKCNSLTAGVTVSIWKLTSELGGSADVDDKAAQLMDAIGCFGLPYLSVTGWNVYSVELQSSYSDSGQLTDKIYFSNRINIQLKLNK